MLDAETAPVFTQSLILDQLEPEFDPGLLTDDVPLKSSSAASSSSQIQSESVQSDQPRAQAVKRSREVRTSCFHPTSASRNVVDDSECPHSFNRRDILEQNERKTQSDRD